MIKRSISITPEVDEIVKKVWSALLRKGYNVSNYSRALQLIILTAVKDVSDEAIEKFIEKMKPHLERDGDE